ncbi:unnamed protein product [Cercospora beticola]|nr:unnamed protein product [Cercospora beticola]
MFTLTFIALLARVAFGDSLGFPSCAEGCLGGYGGCDQLDIKCICSNKAFLEGLSCCVLASCKSSDIDQVSTNVRSLCYSYGETDLPNFTTCTASEVTLAPTTRIVTYVVTGSPSTSESQPSITSNSAPGSNTSSGQGPADADSAGVTTSSASAPTDPNIVTSASTWALTATASSSPMPGSSPNATAIGAGVGAGIGVAVLLAGLLFFWRRQNNKNKPKNPQSSDSSIDAAHASQSMAAKDPDVFPHSAPRTLAWQSDPEVMSRR